MSQPVNAMTTVAGPHQAHNVRMRVDIVAPWGFDDRDGDRRLDSEFNSDKKYRNLGCVAPRRASTRTVAGPPLLNGQRPGGAVGDRFLRGGQILFGEFWLQ